MSLILLLRSVCFFREKEVQHVISDDQRDGRNQEQARGRDEELLAFIISMVIAPHISSFYILKTLRAWVFRYGISRVYDMI